MTDCVGSTIIKKTRLLHFGQKNYFVIEKVAHREQNILRQKYIRTKDLYAIKRDVAMFHLRL